MLTPPRMTFFPGENKSSELGLLAYSNADTIIRALSDAIFDAFALPNIGVSF
jgi:2C-methyl-D-erythritol 2,4-cyclodiphosphate synthase